MAHHSWPYALDADAAPPHDADRLILWLGRRQWRTLLGGVLFGVPWMLSIALVPAAVGRAIDEGLVARDARALVLWAGVIMGLGLVSAVTTNGRHWFAVRNWLIASFRSAVVTDRAVRRAGPALTRRMPAGEVVTSFASDFWRMGNVFDITARLAGAIVSFVVVSVILLQGSVLLGVLMLVGGPVLLASLSLVMRPLQRRQQAQRHEAGLLTSLGADTVAGLRVLRGIGGEDAFLARYAEQSARVRQAGVRLSPVQATLDAAEVLLPGIFVVLVTGVGAHLAAAGEITPGQLVAFYGYTAFLTMPMRTATEFVDKLTRSRVAARRIATILSVEPDHALADEQPRAAFDDRVAECSPLEEVLDDLSHGAPLVDPTSGVVIEPGRLTAIVSARPEETSVIAHRLARTTPGRHGVRWGGVPVDDLPIDAVRARIVVSESDPHLFSGPVREALGGSSDVERYAAIEVASATRRPRRPRGRHGRRARGARTHAVRWSAPAGRPRQSAPARSGRARARRADERRRRAHRGAGGRAARRTPGRPHHGARHRQPAPPRPCRHRAPRRARPGDRPGTAPRPPQVDAGIPSSRAPG